MLPVLTVTLNPAIDQTLTVDRFVAGAVNRVRQTQSHAGGKGVNVAAALADLGAAVAATGWLGEQNDAAFVRLFSKKNIGDRFVRVPGETRTGLKIRDVATGETTDLNFPGLTPPPAAVETLVDRVTAAVRPGGWVVLAGSVPPGVDTGIYGRLIDVVHAGGGRVALDTSGPPLRAAIAHRPDVVKPNMAELAELNGLTELTGGSRRTPATPSEVVAAARAAFVDRGVGLAVVSMGGEGAVFVDAGRALLARPPRVAVVSTVGAGDAMAAGVVFSLARGDPLAAAVRLATALGTDAVTRAGTAGPRDYAGYLDRVEISSVE